MENPEAVILHKGCVAIMSKIECVCVLVCAWVCVCVRVCEGERESTWVGAEKCDRGGGEGRPQGRVFCSPLPWFRWMINRETNPTRFL